MHTEHEIYMHRCLQLAAEGLGYAVPNPVVGAVVVAGDRIAGEGYHARYGQAHAEVNAMRNLDETVLKESTLYVSLEPCNHFGKTPPCVDLILAKKIPRVVIGCTDPFPAVSGKGIARLRANNVEVITGICEAECREINKRFFTFTEKKRPYIVLKFAQTADGFIGRKDPKEPARISSDFSQRMVHRWRSQEAGIMVGTNTAVLDNPQLNNRFWSGSSPVRITIDRNYKIPLTHHLMNGEQPTLIFTQTNPGTYIDNTEFIEAPLYHPNHLPQLLQILYEKNIQSVLVEGGARLLQQFIDNNLWDEARIITSPKVWNEGIKAPQINGHFTLAKEEYFDYDRVTYFNNNSPS